MADSEKLVESLYHQELKRSIENMNGKVKSIKTSFKTDGVVDAEIGINGEIKYLRILLETKFNENFDNKVIRAKVLCQVVSYLKRFDGEGESLPSVILVGDKNECFVVHTNLLMKYLIGDYDWSLAPSVAFKDDKLFGDLIEDKDLHKSCFIYLINDEFNFDDVMNKVKDLFLNVKVKVQITDRSISKVFDYFTLRILKKNSDGTSKYLPREQRDFFMSLVMHTDECYIHPKKKTKAIFKDVEADVHEDAFNSFIDHYTFEYNIDEKKRFSEVCDRLIEDADRRMKGDFYTPSIWVDEAHKMISEHLGADWKQEYMVWDSASGTKNLTRDYKFFELYSSTLGAEDLKISEEYNKEGIAFQYDFLNDDVELFDDLLKRVQQGEFLNVNDFKDSKLYKYAPSLVHGLLNGKKLLFLINPPYAANGEIGRVEGENKTGVGNTKTNAIMAREKAGKGARQLYAQFVYRIAMINKLFNSDSKLAMFSPTLVLTGDYCKELREIMYQNGLGFTDGFMFQASEFADVADNWGIEFVLFDKKSNVSEKNFALKLKNLSNATIQKFGTKTLYALDESKKASKWVRGNVNSLDKTKDVLYLKNAINVYHKQGYKGRVADESQFLGGFFTNANCVEKNNQFVALTSAMMGDSNCINVTKSTFSNVMSYFTARRLITVQYANWMNWQDEYMIPNVKHEKYQQWENDAIIYSLFNGKSNQSSLRNIHYNQKSWDIINHFFFMSEKEMKDLAQGKQDRATVSNTIEQDIINHGGERFVYDKINQIESVKGFSDDAQAVLDKARELVAKSFKYRKLFAQTHPQYQIETWDAGWYQVKAILKEYMKDDLDEFTKLYKELENRMRPLVYELGFLYE